MSGDRTGPRFQPGAVLPNLDQIEKVKKNYESDPQTMQVGHEILFFLISCEPLNSEYPQSAHFHLYKSVCACVYARICMSKKEREKISVPI